MENVNGSDRTELVTMPLVHSSCRLMNRLAADRYTHEVRHHWNDHNFVHKLDDEQKNSALSGDGINVRNFRRISYGINDPPPRLMVFRCLYGKTEKKTNSETTDIITQTTQLQMNNSEEVVGRSEDEDFHIRLSNQLKASMNPGYQPGTLLSLRRTSVVRNSRVIRNRAFSPRRRLIPKLMVFEGKEFHERLVCIENCARKVNENGQITASELDGPFHVKSSNLIHLTPKSPDILNYVSVENSNDAVIVTHSQEKGNSKSSVSCEKGDEVIGVTQREVSVSDPTPSCCYLKSTSRRCKPNELRIACSKNQVSEEELELARVKRIEIERALSLCMEGKISRFGLRRNKKCLLLNNLGMTEKDIPLTKLCGTSLGNTLTQLSISGNKLNEIPTLLVRGLPSLRSLDLSHCGLHTVPDKWNLPRLSHLKLCYNHLRDFPSESFFEGLSELKNLNLYANKIAFLTLPSRIKCVKNLVALDIGYNELSRIPRSLVVFKNLKSLNLTNNCITEIPQAVCEMALKTLNVSSNPIAFPPMDVCNRGLRAMRRYWSSRRMEELTEDIYREFQLSGRKKEDYKKSRSRQIRQRLTGSIQRTETSHSSSTDRSTDIFNSSA